MAKARYPFYSNAGASGGSATGAFAITPHDDNELPVVTQYIYAEGAGNIEVVWADGSTTIEPVAAGERLAWSIKQVKAENTTATGLRGYY